MKVDIGYKIKEVFDTRNMKLTDFANELGTVRQNVYRIFKKQDLDTGLLKRVSEVLNHNFFQYYVTSSENLYSKEAIEDLIVESSLCKQELELAKKEIAYLRKIISLIDERSDQIQHQPKDISDARTYSS
jgi:hypothetical protein